MNIRTGLALGALLVMAMTGCSKPAADGDGIASAGTGTTSASATGAADEPVDEKEAALKFGQCMRDNGLPDFKDPDTSGGGISIELPRGTDKATVDAAQEKCKKFLPGGGEPPKISEEQLEEQRKMSQCMRDNGVPDFPDPDATGGIRIEGKRGTTLDPDSDTFKAAEEKCAQFGGPGRSNKKTEK